MDTPTLATRQPASTQPPTRIPMGALLPGLLGLVPFWGLALATVVDFGIASVGAVLALVMYGAVILTFVGALWWGMAVNAPASAPRQLMFVWSVIPALIGWFAMIGAAPDVGLRMVIAGLVLQWLLDSMLMRKVPDLFPRWVFRLRTILTSGSVAALGLAWWQLFNA